MALNTPSKQLIFAVSTGLSATLPLICHASMCLFYSRLEALVAEWQIKSQKNFLGFASGGVQYDVPQKSFIMKVTAPTPAPPLNYSLYTSPSGSPEGALRPQAGVKPL